MIETNRQYVSDRLPAALARLGARLKDGVRWWAEHQAWPARDAIRIDDVPAANLPRSANFR